MHLGSGATCRCVLLAMDDGATPCLRSKVARVWSSPPDNLPVDSNFRRMRTFEYFLWTDVRQQPILNTLKDAGGVGCEEHDLGAWVGFAKATPCAQQQTQ